MFSGLCLFEATSPYLKGKLVFSCKIHFSAPLSSLLGVDKVIQYAVTEWLTDIRKNQLPGILGGVGPMHSVVQLCEFILHVSSPNIPLYTVVRLIIELFLILFYLFGLPFAFLPISVCFFSPWSERSLLAAHWAVQKGWAHYSRSPEGGRVLRHLHSISCSGAQQQAGAGHTGTQSFSQWSIQTQQGLRYLWHHCWYLSASLTGHSRDSVWHPFSNSAPEPLHHHRRPGPLQPAPQSCSARRPQRRCGKGLRHRQRGAFSKLPSQNSLRNHLQHMQSSCFSYILGVAVLSTLCNLIIWETHFT